MSLHDVDSIDYIGVNILFRHVYVGIFDDLDWDDESTHFALLTKKIDRYTQYIRSGQLLAGYPGVRGYGIVFEYVATWPMTVSATRFWKSREQIIRSAGYEVRSRTVDVRPVLRGEASRDAAAETGADEALAESLHEAEAEAEAETLSRIAPLLSLPAPALVTPTVLGRALIALPQLTSMRR
ncbi:hypothetical protein AWB81_06395 [Caballeronia arationis]|jgi:hypothetical protein|uniref:Uncharacterized protein n=1 Tax=Caballeronia arationis TaxID=1777142 RepID=A0A7Z7I5J9_9BURK|nr:DUF6572 domain-containing protein [Caballeronia arationis]SAL03373.1 hypothetical protein AWB81_06395 [Caballeronia arationis]SOE65135.1 hypothetical protein SAMN05446927_2851 [Caballeronia arationis]